MKRNKGLLTGIIIGVLALSTWVTFLGAIIAHGLANNVSDFIGDFFQIDSYITKHLVTDSFFVVVSTILYILTFWKIESQTFSFIILIILMVSIYVFGSDFLLHIDAIGVDKFDPQWGMAIFGKVTWTFFIYPIIGFLYDKKQATT